VILKRRKPTPEDIRDAWDQAERDFGDKSTEFLAAIVADRLNIEYADVFDGLHDSLTSGADDAAV
jgi:hypothetical protein